MEKRTKERKLHILRKYWDAMPKFLRYQAASKLFLLGLIFLLQQLAEWIIHSTKRAVITSGDFRFLFQSMKGWALIFVALAALILYILFDINAKIIISDDILHNRKTRLTEIPLRIFQTLPPLLGFRGLLVALYIGILAPLVGSTFTISLTSKFRVPNFVLSVIRSNPFSMVCYRVFTVILLFLGLYHMYTLHFVILKGERLPAAMRDARSFFRVHWKSLLKDYFLYYLSTVLLFGIYVLIAFAVPLLVRKQLALDDNAFRHFGLLLAYLVIMILEFVFTLTITPLQFLESTRLFYVYRDEDLPFSHQSGNIVRELALFLGSVGLSTIIAFTGAAILSLGYDEFFGNRKEVKIIAHRAGGTMGPENTVEGLQLAIAENLYGAEIDVQRTADHHYIINHDTTFRRLCGVNQVPMNMTLKEIQALTVTDKAGSAPVSTLEQMLDAAKDHIHLFVELKGASADEEMAEDVIAMIRKRDMMDECTLISLNLPLINYIEEKYPEINTGYLIYFAYGDVSSLPCDTLALEEKSATSIVVNNIHSSEKNAFVWTVNTERSLRSFLDSNVDAIITDEIRDARDVQKELSHRTDAEKILDLLIP